MNTVDEIRNAIWAAIEKHMPSDLNNGSLQSGSILNDVKQQITINDIESQQRALTVWNDLFRHGHLSWGLNFSNPDPPFFHLTSLGQASLQERSRDPSNREGYMANLTGQGSCNTACLDYVDEALSCYATGSYRASAVMLGAAMEILILDLRDNIVAAIEANSVNAPSRLKDWKISTVLGALDRLVSDSDNSLTEQLFSDFTAHWAGIAYQIRTTRNDAGHPANLGPIEQEMVHSSFLLFPRFSNLTASLKGEICAWYA